MTPLHVVGQSGDKEMATFLFENGEHSSICKMCLYGRFWAFFVCMVVACVVYS